MALADEIRAVLSDPMNLPPEFLDGITQHQAQNTVPVGAQRAPMLIPTGTPGATAASRLVGATTSLAPTSGTFQVGDVVTDQSGAMWVCTVAGSPGVWTQVGAYGREIAYDQINSGNVPILGTVVGSSTTVISGSSNMYDGGPVVAEFYCPAILLPAVAGGFFTVVLFDSGGVPLAYIGQFQNPTAAAHWVGATLRYRFTPSAGSHTYFIKCFVSSTTGTPAIGAGAGGSATAPAYLRITKV